jgi:hypothetical protein
MRQLLVFMFACCVYLAAVRDLAMWPTMTSQLFFTQLGAWLALLALYGHWRLWSSVVVHTATFSAILFMSLMFAFAFALRNTFLATWADPVVIGCALATLISFPIAVVTISFRGSQRRPSRRDIHLPRWARQR